LFDDIDEAAGLRADIIPKVDVDGIMDGTEAVMKPEGIGDAVGEDDAGDVSSGIAGLLAGVEEANAGPPPCTRNGCTGAVG
jgi:hypothetical protein